MSYIEKTDGVDLQHLYIDGSKFEANANKYSWVWKKATEKSRYRLYAKITSLFTEMNETLAYTGMKIDTGKNTLRNVLRQYWTDTLTCAKSTRKTLLRDEAIGRAGSSGIMKTSRGI